MHGVRVTEHLVGRCDGNGDDANLLFIEISQKANDVCVHRHNGQKVKRFDLLQQTMSARRAEKVEHLENLNFEKSICKFCAPNRAALSLSRIGYS